MIEDPWDESFFAECAARFVKVERKLTDVQLQYLCQYYIMNKFPQQTQVEEIAKQWNIDDFDFYMNLEEWFSGRRMAELHITQRRDKARKAAA